jgi:hypothetical protein
MLVLMNIIPIMRYQVKVNSVKTIDELEDSWTNADFTALLEKFGYAEAAKVNPDELKDYLFMAITDFDPTEAAAVLLAYKLSEVLTEGQIDHLSREMLREKVAENYSDIYIHKILFGINQLLYKAYNGKFPLTRANVVEFEMRPEHDDETELTKETALKALSISLSESSLVNRLLKEQTEGKAPFPEAEGIIWDLQNKGNGQYLMVTSEKWLNKDSFEKMEYECTVVPFIEKSGEE